MSQPFGFCPHCGASFGRRKRWPRDCPSCQVRVYRNPLPVVVLLLPILDQQGLLTVRRGIEPGLGKLALPGGFLDWNDADWQAGMVRELREETGIRIRRTGIVPVNVFSSNGKLIVFGRARGIDSSKLPAVVDNEEISGVEVITKPVELAFPSHTAAARQFFESVETENPKNTNLH